MWHGMTMRAFALAAGLAGLLLGAPLAAQPAGSFADWLAAYRAGAIARGLEPQWLDQALAGLEPQLRVVELDRAQPDAPGRAVLASYLARQLTDERIATGRARAAERAALLRRLEREHGVPGEVLVAIWGMETSYGRVMGGFDILRALATLAWDGRRAELFTRELDAAVQMVGQGKVDRASFRGSWAGAFGHPQFLPSSYLRFAIDGDGDGRADIMGNPADALASIANYLKQNGWSAGVPWGLRVAPPPGFDAAAVANPEQPTRCIRPMQAHSRFLPAREWRARGFQALGGAWPADDVELSFVQPDGPGTAAFLATRNYRAIMAYNCSNFYALSVALLGDALRAPSGA
jgi:membrane-bound lytic murein transglycosylase B